MEVEQTALRLIPLLYDGAMQAGDMQPFADALTGELGDFSAGVAMRLPGFAQPPVISTSDDDPEAVRAYADYFHSLDPKISCMSRTPLYRLEETTRGLCIETLRRTEFYGDFVLAYKRAWGPHYAAVLSAERGHPVASFFVRNRRPDAHAKLSDRGRRLVEILIPHVVSARRVWASLDEVSVRDEGLRSALDSMDMGVVLLDVSQRVCWASRMAEAILASRDGLHTKGSELHADCSREDARLQKQIAEAIQMTSGASLPEGGVVSLSRPSGRRSLELVVAPVGHDSSLRTVAPTGGALVFMLDPEVGLPDEQEVLRALYGFTPAEARFARLLANDLSLNEAAVQAGITVQTARHRLKCLFEKTDSHRQSSLVRLLVRGPASLALRGDSLPRPR